MNKLIILLSCIFSFASCNNVEKRELPPPRGQLLASGFVEDYNCNQCTSKCRVKIVDTQFFNNGNSTPWIDQYIEIDQLVLKRDYMCLVKFWCRERTGVCQYDNLFPGYMSNSWELFQSDDIWTRCDRSDVTDFFFLYKGRWI